MKNLYASLIILGLFFGGYFINQKSKVITSATLNKILKSNQDSTAHILIEEDKYGKSWIEILKSRKENTLIIRTKRDEDIISIAGYGNSENQVNENGSIVIDTLDFQMNAKKEYLLPTYIKGSTYGASIFYIVYYDSSWQVFRVPFDRVNVRYEKKIGQSVIVEYKATGDSTLYKFKSGLLIPI